jgi:hypothetical protein
MTKIESEGNSLMATQSSYRWRMRTKVTKNFKRLSGSKSNTAKRTQDRPRTKLGVRRWSLYKLRDSEVQSIYEAFGNAQSNPSTPGHSIFRLPCLQKEIGFLSSISS